MLLKSGTLFMVFFTFQISESLANSQECDRLANIKVCLRNKNLEIQIAADDQTSKVGDVFQQQVRDDYIHTPGVGYHKFHTVGKPWNQARKMCMAEGGHLAVVNSQKEFEVLIDIYKRQAKDIKAENANWVWLGGHNFYENNDWVSVHGEPLDSTGFNRWLTNEPSSHKNENCLNFHAIDGYDGYGGYGLNDGTCYTSLPFFCEMSGAFHQVYSILNDTVLTELMKDYH